MKPSNSSAVASTRAIPILSLVALLMGCTVEAKGTGDAGPPGATGPTGPQGVPGVPCAGCVDSASLAAASVGTGALIDGSVTSAKLGAASVLTAAIADANVTSSKLAAGAVVTAALATNAVTTAKFAAGAVDSAALGTGAVTSTKLAANAVTSAAGAVGATQIATGAVGATQIASASITGAKIDPTTSITAANFVFGSPKTARVIVQSFGFVPNDNTTTWSGAAILSNGFRDMTGGTLVMAAPVNFPDGATLTNLSSRLFDNVNNAHETIYLRRFDGIFDAVTITQVGTTDAETGGALTKSVSFTHAVDNRSNAAYFLVWEEGPAGSTGLGSSLGIYSVEVDYTYTSP
jgi:hypothetical protein